MSQTQTSIEALPDRDRQIIDHVVRHRITTNEVIQNLFFPDQQPNAVTKVTARLCRTKLLRKFPLYHPRTYFTLGPQAAQLLGLSSHRTLPLGPQSLPIEFGALAYAALGPQYQRRLTPRELQSLYPWLDTRLLEAPHCINESGNSPLLELVRVDLGGKPDHVARKCDADIQARQRFPEFAGLLQQRVFRLVVVTGTTEKAGAIRESLDVRMWPDGLQIHLAVVPDLLHLTASLSDGP